MSEIKFGACELNHSELQKMWEKHRSMINSFISGNGLDHSKISIDENAVLSVITKVNQRRQYFELFHGIKMSEFKEVALNAFWIAKLKPLSVGDLQIIREQRKEYDALNEKLALYYILRCLRAALKNKRKSEDVLDALSSEYIDEFIYTLMYRDISKEALIMLVESMAILMGINPYAAE